MLGVTAMYLATKMEEVYPPTIEDMAFITDKAYTEKDIVRLEEQMLKALDFDLSVPTSYRFLERYSRIISLDKQTFFLSQYLLELAFLDSKMN